MNQEAKMNIRKSIDRGQAKHNWLKSFHTFSFADYHDPLHMGFRTLRVLNEDTVEPDKGFGTHAHRDMEIISYVIEGSLEHKDSMGNGSIIHQGCFQLISAGSGITHSEFNPSKKQKVRFLQMWVSPNQIALKPSYQELNVADIISDSPLKLVCSPKAEKTSMLINQDAYIYFANLKEGESFVYDCKNNYGLWVQMIEGQIDVNGSQLNKGDGASIEEVKSLKITAHSTAQFILFELN